MYNGCALFKENIHLAFAETKNNALINKTNIFHISLELWKLKLLRGSFKLF